MSRVVVIGEAMVEEHAGGIAAGSGYGGDTLNTAIHLARLGHDVAFVTALGNDAQSSALKTAWAAEGIDTNHVMNHPHRTVGCYAIELDEHGERKFRYDRDESAARDMFGLPGMSAALGAAKVADLVFFSLITLAILSPKGRERLLELPARLAFDGNYRPQLWPGSSEAARALGGAIARADIGLPTLEDEASILGASTTAEAVARRWQAAGCRETVVKMGVHGCRLPDGNVSAPPQALRPVDTSGAGDAFNAGYLSARLKGGSPSEAAAEGHRVAGWTIMRPGAIPRLSD